MKGIVLSSFALSAAVAGALWAQPMRGSGGPCAGNSFDPAKVETVSGQIAEIASYGRGRGGGGLHAKLKTSSGVVEVMLGPSAFVTSQAVKLAKDDQVDVTGWRVQTPRFGDQLIAREVHRGNDVLKLRDANGLPSWAGGGGGFGGPANDWMPCARGPRQ
jgi:hypothetical protein